MSLPTQQAPPPPPTPLAARRFAVAIAFSGLAVPLDQARAGVLRSLTGGGREPWGEALGARALFSARAGGHWFLAPFTAEEFLAWGFEVLAVAHWLCLPPAADDVLRHDVPASECRALLLWRDPGDPDWRPAVATQGAGWALGVICRR